MNRPDCLVCLNNGALDGLLRGVACASCGRIGGKAQPITQPECFALHGDPSKMTGPIACSLCGAWRPLEGAPLEFLKARDVDARALEAARQRVNGLRCYYCATFDRVEAAAMMTAHDRRGCKHVCFKHAEWRLKRNWLEGHSADCAAGAACRAS